MRVRTGIELSRIVFFGADVRELAEGATFSLPGTSLAVKVRGATSLSIKMDSGLNSFVVRIRDTESGEEFTDHINPNSGLRWIEISENLVRSRSYYIILSKKSESEIRTAVSCFTPVIVEAVRCDGLFEDLLSDSVFTPRGWIEVLGDSDACGFGVDGSVTSPSNFFSMDPEKEDVYGAWGCQLADLLELGPLAARIIASSGKGVIRNAPFCGSETIPDLWENLERSHELIRTTGPPRFIALMIGGNDYFDHRGPDPDSFFNGFKQFLRVLRNIRGDSVPIFVFQCRASCMSSGGSPTVHPNEDESCVDSANRLCRLTQEAVESAGGKDQSIHFHALDLVLNINSDYGIMMHWNRVGQRKIAEAMLRFIHSCCR